MLGFLTFVDFGLSLPGLVGGRMGTPPGSRLCLRLSVIQSEPWVGPALSNHTGLGLDYPQAAVSPRLSHPVDASMGFDYVGQTVRIFNLAARLIG